MRDGNLPLIVLILSSLVLPPVNVRSNDLALIEVEGPADLLRYVTAMSMMIEDYEGNEAFFGYKVLGEENVRGHEAWIVLWNYSSAGGEEISEFKLWISKSEGIAVQVEIEGEKITESTLTSPITEVTIGFFTGVIYQSWSTWDINELQDLPHGELTIIGNGTEQYGLTPMQVLKYEYVGETSAPEQYRYRVETWTTSTPFGSIVTYLYVESIMDENWFSWEVESIELAEATETTEEPPLTDIEEPEEKEEETTGEEPSEITTEHERKGIPGFPFEATFFGILAVVLFMSMRAHNGDTYEI